MAREATHVQNVLNEPLFGLKHLTKAEMTKLTDHRRSVYVQYAARAVVDTPCQLTDKVGVKVTECRVLGGPRSCTGV